VGRDYDLRRPHGARGRADYRRGALAQARRPNAFDHPAACVLDQLCQSQQPLLRVELCLVPESHSGQAAIGRRRYLFCG
jgi:hypothetical protein